MKAEVLEDLLLCINIETGCSLDEAFDGKDALNPTQGVGVIASINRVPQGKGLSG